MYTCDVVVYTYMFMYIYIYYTHIFSTEFKYCLPDVRACLDEISVNHDR